MDPPQKHEKIKLVEINSYLTCYLCKGYLIDATTISECLHSFCRSCIIKFLQEKCYCPVCEVIINKAKPCLKLDKTLQDIVYKLVPELFVKEMYRRKEFYQNRPTLAPKVSPEERGEDTERTIFNPQDAISLSIEYISDDSAPGAIPVLPLTQKNGTQIEEPQDNPMKRYLQCPGMCRIEVLKKFVRNKYNVDTNLFHIDILYKRVPLPDHYTLIDIGYIYSWKRNEPMKFFFRITDINKVAERFDYFDGRVSPEIIHKPIKTKGGGDKEKTNNKTDSRKKEINKEVAKPAVVSIKEEKKEIPEVKKEPEVEVKSVVKQNNVKDEVKCFKPNTNKDEVLLKPEITEEIKNKIQNGKSDIKNSVYTNITLNRDDNVEIITKIQKVSNKEGHPIGLNIINHTVKKTNKVQTNKNRPTFNQKLVVPTKDHEKETTEKKTEEIRDKEKEELEKSNFLKSIQLTAKNSITTTATEKKDVKPTTSSPSSTKIGPSPPPPTSKRKNSSPVKNDKVQDKKSKIDKKPVKIIIQPKTIQNPAVRQIVTNVNQNVNNMSKIVEQTTPKTTDLQSLIDNCKINIPSSLSITLNEGGEGGARTPPSIPPVKNYIEILKLPENGEKAGKDEVKNEKLSSPAPGPATSVKDKNRNIPTFQKIFEESIVKKSPEFSISNNNNNNNSKGKVEGVNKTSPLDLTNATENGSTSSSGGPGPGGGGGAKRKILEIASQLHKKTKIEQEKKKEQVASVKIAIPRLATQRTLKPASNKYEFNSLNNNNRPAQTSASMHSSSLGLNYTVSVGDVKTSAGQDSKRVTTTTTPSTSKTLTKPLKSSPKNLSPNQLLEKYNIQNLAQLTAGFNFNSNSFGGGQFTALQHAMLLKQIEHQNWLNQGPLLQYEKYLQSLSATQNKIMGNIKEN